MGVNDRRRIAHDREVDLRGGGPQQKDIAGHVRARDALETRVAQRIHGNREPAPARAVVRRKPQFDSDPGEADQHQTDAVEAVRAIAPLQAERRADQLTRCLGERDIPLHQACDG